MHALSDTDVHIWHGVVEQFEDYVSGLEAVLSQEERARCDRIRLPRQRNVFTLGRGLLRTLLSHYLDTDAGRFELGYAEHGKPYLAPHQNPGRLSFNLSHSGSALIYAVTRLPTVGVDVEYTKRKVDVSTLGKRVLTARELESLERTREAQRAELFFRYWTHKEAYLKALGLGLSGGMARLEVGSPDADGMSTLRDRARDSRYPHWTLKRLAIAEDYAAAVAVASPKAVFLEQNLRELLPLSPRRAGR